jgi:NAD(P)-dependent dehydrogenase (short-subunit alcohol dehydrogenase family)
MTSLDLFDLHGKVALVTGAGSLQSMGYAMAAGLAEAGADVAISDYNADLARGASAAIARLGRRSLAITCDNASREQIQAMFAAMDREFGRIDILINTVGAGARYRPEDLSFEEWQRVINISLTGTFLCSTEAGRRMIRQGTGGSIISISSTCGYSGMGRGNFVHSISKSGINSMTKELAVEWAPHGIRVNAILPAQVRSTGWTAEAYEASTGWDYPAFERHLLEGIPLGRLGVPADVVGPALFLASDASGFITGHLLPVDGGNLVLNAAGSVNWPAAKIQE